MLTIVYNIRNLNIQYYICICVILEGIKLFKTSTFFWHYNAQKKKSLNNSTLQQHYKLYSKYYISNITQINYSLQSLYITLKHHPKKVSTFFYTIVQAKKNSVFEEGKLSQIIKLLEVLSGI